MKKGIRQQFFCQLGGRLLTAIRLRIVSASRLCLVVKVRDSGMQCTVLTLLHLPLVEVGNAVRVYYSTSPIAPYPLTF